MTTIIPNLLLKDTHCPYLSTEMRTSPLLPWLTAAGSLTAKIEALTARKLQVVPQFEGRKTLSLLEKRQLSLLPATVQSAWVREAWLYGFAEQDAWIAARSVFPFQSLIGNARQLANLGTTPIGYILFARNGAKLTRRWLQHTPSGWQRTSLYDWQGRKFLISETFLPSFCQYITQ